MKTPHHHLLLTVTAMVAILSLSGCCGSSDDAYPDTAPPVVPEKTEDHKDIEIRNACSNDVTVFFGDKPGFSAGRYSTIKKNGTLVFPLEKGDVVWIVDADKKGLDKAVYKKGVKSLEIERSCESWDVKKKKRGKKDKRRRRRRR